MVARELQKASDIREKVFDNAGPAKPRILIPNEPSERLGIAPWLS